MTRLVSTIVLLAVLFAVPASSSAHHGSDGVANDHRQSIREIKALVKELLRRIERLEASLSQAEAPVEAVTSIKRLGLELKPLSQSELGQLVSRHDRGMKIVGVEAGSAAAESGIRVGDILVGLHIWETGTRENVEYALNKAITDKLNSLKFYILRDSQTTYGHLRLTR